MTKGAEQKQPWTGRFFWLRPDSVHPFSSWEGPYWQVQVRDETPVHTWEHPELSLFSDCGRSPEVTPDPRPLGFEPSRCGVWVLTTTPPVSKHSGRLWPTVLIFIASFMTGLTKCFFDLQLSSSAVFQLQLHAGITSVPSQDEIINYLD